MLILGLSSGRRWSLEHKPGGRSKSPSATSKFRNEVAARFGLVPKFFKTAPEAPEVVPAFWTLAKSAYIDSPMPTAFKERLFVYLSRFCEVRYCIVRHFGFLIGKGHSAG